MQEPAYILKNGQSVPYIPVTVTTSREAYAASLHVLFKHVADFHICVVRVFSAKYGIPEDDILKTIQESDEFKNMHVDPVLDTDNIDSLGYLAEVPAPKEEVPEPDLATTPVQKAKPIKAKKTKNPEPVPMDPIILAEESRPVESDPAIKTIRKKIVPKPTQPITDPTPTPVVAEPVTRPEPIKTKTILKKIVQKPTQPIDEPAKAAPATTAASSVPTTVITTASSVPTTAASSVPTTAITATAAASSVPTTAEDAPRKIIKKKAKAAV